MLNPAELMETLRGPGLRLGDISVGEITDDLREEFGKAISGDSAALKSLVGKVARRRAEDARKGPHFHEWGPWTRKV